MSLSVIASGMAIATAVGLLCDAINPALLKGFPRAFIPMLVGWGVVFGLLALREAR